MRRRIVIAVASCSFIVLGLACVDLFHATDFETLCTRSPNDPSCGGDGAPSAEAGEGAAPDADAARPHPDFCAWSSTEARTQALRACAWLGACERPLGESAFGPCVVRAQLAFDCGANPGLRPSGPADAFWGCLATVQSCGDVDRCVFPGGVQDCVAVISGSSSACGTLGPNAAVLLKCAGPAGRAAGVEPCVMLGQTCAAEDLSTAECSGTRGFLCSDAGCTGSAAVDCVDKGTKERDQGIDCANYGAGSCVPGDGGVFCKGGNRATTSCAADAPPTCDGTTATSCVDGKELRIECDRVGLPCDVTPPFPSHDPTAACRGGGACTGTKDTCDGDKLQSCGRGAAFEINCASVGLGTCKLAGDRGACTAP